MIRSEPTTLFVLPLVTGLTAALVGLVAAFELSGFRNSVSETCEPAEKSHGMV